MRNIGTFLIVSFSLYLNLDFLAFCKYISATLCLCIPNRQKEVVSRLYHDGPSLSRAKRYKGCEGPRHLMACMLCAVRQAFLLSSSVVESAGSALSLGLAAMLTISSFQKSAGGCVSTFRTLLGFGFDGGMRNRLRLFWEIHL